MEILKNLPQIIGLLSLGIGILTSLLNRNKTQGLGAALAQVLFYLSRREEKWRKPLNRIATTFIDLSNGFEARWDTLSRKYRLKTINQARKTGENKGNFKKGYMK